MTDKSKQKETEKQPQAYKNTTEKEQTQQQAQNKDKRDAAEEPKEEAETQTKAKSEEKQAEDLKSDKAKAEKKDKKKSGKKEKKQDPKDAKIQELGEQVEKLNERYLRLQAEFDNYRKRTIRERADLLKSAGEDVLKDLLPVIDDIDRAVETIEAAEDIEAIKLGIQLIDQKFKEFINQKGVKEIDAMHQDFDTDVHEAMTKIPAPKEELRGKVVDVIQKGYKLNEKVIRFAKVVIGE